MFKVTAAQVLEASRSGALVRVGAVDLSVKYALKVRKLQIAVNRESGVLEKLVQECWKKHGGVVKDDKMEIQVKLPDGKENPELAILTAELNELGKQEVELDGDPVDLSSLTDMEVRANDVASLNGLILFEKPEKA